MSKSIWFMEGLSSQRDIVMQFVEYFKKPNASDVSIIASHRNNRTEILSVADHAYIEPKNNDELLGFMKKVIDKHNVFVVHTSNRNHWFEKNRASIESLGVKLITGAKSVYSLSLADNKVAFAQKMEEIGLPVVPSIRVSSADELESLIKTNPFGDLMLCVKPVKGIYGLGFWVLDPNAPASSCFVNPDNRIVNPEVYLHAIKQNWPEDMVLMPYLPGDEYSVDMFVNDGEVVMAVGRCKQGSFQSIHIEGEAIELAKKCASAMRADGLVNVQTKVDVNGNHVLLEINMRPSGGISYSQFSRVSVINAFACYLADGLTESHLKWLTNQFCDSTVRAHSTVLSIDHTNFKCEVSA